MKPKFVFRIYAMYSLIAAILYCFAVGVFFIRAVYADLWWLYVGNILFVIALLFGTVRVHQKLNDTPAILTMIFRGHKMILSSIAMLLPVIIVMFFVLQNANAQNSPANSKGLAFMLAINAIMVNFFAGSTGIIFGAVATDRSVKKKDEKANVVIVK